MAQYHDQTAKLHAGQLPVALQDSQDRNNAGSMIGMYLHTASVKAAAAEVRQTASYQCTRLLILTRDADAEPAGDSAMQHHACKRAGNDLVHHF